MWQQYTVVCVKVLKHLCVLGRIERQAYGTLVKVSDTDQLD